MILPDQTEAKRYAELAYKSLHLVFEDPDPKRRVPHDGYGLSRAMMGLVLASVTIGAFRIGPTSNGSGLSVTSTSVWMHGLPIIMPTFITVAARIGWRFVVVVNCCCSWLPANTNSDTSDTFTPRAGKASGQWLL